jgi:hypothetical protein
MKKAFGLLIALGAMSLMGVSAYAAEYSVESATAQEGGTVTLTLKAKADDDAKSVNGYALNISYDSSVLTPVGLTDENGDAVNDLTGSQLYATNKVDDGVMVASPIEGNDVLAVAWANDTALTLTSEDTDLATVTFKVADEVSVDSTDLDIVVVADAIDATTLDTTSKAVGGVVTLGAEYLLGDINGDGVVNSLDTGLLSRYTSNAITLEELESSTSVAGASERAEINGDGIINSLDYGLLSRYTSGTITTDEFEAAAKSN